MGLHGLLQGEVYLFKEVGLEVNTGNKVDVRTE
jgi:hypothetical protein